MIEYDAAVCRFLPGLDRGSSFGPLLAGSLPPVLLSHSKRGVRGNETSLICARARELDRCVQTPPSG